MIAFIVLTSFFVVTIAFIWLTVAFIAWIIMWFRGKQ